MADVCGQLTGVPGVCFGTFGPGATNLSTGVGCALLDRSPMIAFTDELPASMRGRTTQMGIDHQALFRPLTKKTTRLEPGRVQEILFDATRTALSERPGPVHIGLPVDISAKRAPLRGSPWPEPEAPPMPSEEVLLTAAELLRRSRKPVLAIGLGAVRAGVRNEVLNLAEGIPGAHRTYPDGKGDGVRGSSLLCRCFVSCPKRSGGSDPSASGPHHRHRLRSRPSSTTNPGCPLCPY